MTSAASCRDCNFTMSASSQLTHLLSFRTANSRSSQQELSTHTLSGVQPTPPYWKSHTCDIWIQSSAPDLRVPGSIQDTQKASVTEHIFTTSRPTGSAPIVLGRQGWCYLWLAAGKGECHNLAVKAPVYDSNNGPWRHLASFCGKCSRATRSG